MYTNENSNIFIPLPSAVLTNHKELVNGILSLIDTLDDPAILNSGVYFDGPMGTRHLLDMLNEVYRRLVLAGDIFQTIESNIMDHEKPDINF